MKKAQVIMEFLMIYGWAILVVLAAIAALVYFGIFAPTPDITDPVNEIQPNKLFILFSYEEKTITNCQRDDVLGNFVDTQTWMSKHSNMTTPDRIVFVNINPHQWECFPREDYGLDDDYWCDCYIKPNIDTKNYYDGSGNIKEMEIK